MARPLHHSAGFHSWLERCFRDDIAGSGCMDHLAVARVDPYMARPGRAPAAEDEVTRLRLLNRHLDPDSPLLLGRPGERDLAGTGRMDRERGQARAVEPTAGGPASAPASPDVRRAQILARRRNDRPLPSEAFGMNRPREFGLVKAARAAVILAT